MGKYRLGGEAGTTVPFGLTRRGRRLATTLARRLSSLNLFQLFSFFGTQLLRHEIIGEGGTSQGGEGLIYGPPPHPAGPVIHGGGDMGIEGEGGPVGGSIEGDGEMVSEGAADLSSLLLAVGDMTAEGRSDSSGGIGGDGEMVSEGEGEVSAELIEGDGEMVSEGEGEVS